ncbi:hypothetical protein SteCoe_15389 [Stentor coeruleus]|uniref:Adenylate kinase n=1 Tax=Stentor coeruleus TaxID=5963 RepID=A0A1R2C3V3_9CILI|nr:hypothetical protein SteCoe_15389 [Stentor coeruleus]
MDLKQKQDFQEEVEIFLDQYQIHDLFDYLLKELLIDRPDEPIDYLISKLQTKRRRRLFLIGGIGSRRRQIARELSSRFQIEKIFLLDHLKAEVKKSGKHGSSIQKAWNTGSYIPDNIILDIMMPHIEELEKKGSSYILEGFPRTRVQGLALQRAGVIPDRLVLMVPTESEIRAGVIERMNELVPVKQDNQNNIFERAIQEFSYHANGIRSAYNTQVYEISASGETSVLSSQIFRVFLAKGRSKAPRKPPKVIILGPPGSGRSSLATALANSYGLTFVSTLQLLRDQVNRKTETGRNVSAIINTGERVPDYIMTELVRSRLKEPDCRINGWVLDGYPKTIEQARSLREFKIIPSHVLFLECADAMVYERVEQRRLDPITGVYYNVMNLPEDEGIRSRVVFMNEDHHENVKKRLANYKEHYVKIHAEYSGHVTNIKADLDFQAVVDIARDVIESSIHPDND